MDYVKGWWPYPVLDWRGVRLYQRRTSGSEEEGTPAIASVPLAESEAANQSEFSTLFRTILPRLNSYGWIFLQDSFNTLSLPENEQEQKEEFLFSTKITDEVCYTDMPRFLDEWAAVVRDDWNRLFGFPAPITDPSTIPGKDTPIDVQLIQAADVLFDNYDGAYWACYSRDESLIDKICRANVDRPDLLVVPCTFRETYETHEKEWVEWERTHLKHS